MTRAKARRLVRRHADAELLTDALGLTTEKQDVCPGIPHDDHTTSRELCPLAGEDE